ncbi:hypothetical protein FN846DRAFT_973478 [Sphaerosporella brunnea]|uniref:Uncharacterized protein n=1 Tax=Sphaerosporella brunnea TaxID=1250544 RepID=A0A5J5EFW4_9PEZI|nr:hypothetical protein FN846DRAFT_973478 [Sphaerosporella brunnea]
MQLRTPGISRCQTQVHTPPLERILLRHRRTLRPRPCISGPRWCPRPSRHCPLRLRDLPLPPRHRRTIELIQQLTFPQSSAATSSSVPAPTTHEPAFPCSCCTSSTGCLSQLKLSSRDTMSRFRPLASDSRRSRCVHCGSVRSALRVMARFCGVEYSGPLCGL